MSLTSLGLASAGLLDRGGKPALHIATLGHIRYGGVIEPEQPLPGGGVAVWSYTAPRLSKKERERLKRAARKLKAASKRELEAVEESTIDVQALERAVEQAAREALASLPEREPSGRKQRPPLVDIWPEDYVVPPVVDYDINLRLLLLLGV